MYSIPLGALRMRHVKMHRNSRIVIALLFFLFVGLSIHYCVKRRRTKRAFANLEAPGGGPIPAYNVAAPQMEQGYAAHWVPPSQPAPQVPNPFQGGQPYGAATSEQPYGAPPGPPPNLAHGHSYDTGPSKQSDAYSSFHEVKINA